MYQLVREENKKNQWNSSIFERGNNEKLYLRYSTIRETDRQADRPRSWEAAWTEAAAAATPPIRQLPAGGNIERQQPILIPGPSDDEEGKKVVPTGFETSFA